MEMVGEISKNLQLGPLLFGANEHIFLLQDDIFFPLLGIFLAIVYCCFIFATAREKCPGILVELKFNLCDMLESSIVSHIYIIHLIVITLGMKYALGVCTM